MRKLIAVCAIFLPILSFAQSQQEYQRTKVCNPDAAFAAGLNAGKSNDDMEVNFAAKCGAYTKTLNAKYADGYKFGYLNQKEQLHETYNRRQYKPPEQCLETFGKKVCGYDCKKSFNKVMCAEKPSQQCIVGNFGNIECGYSCIKAGQSIACAKHKNHTCVGNSFGDIKCGKHCFKKFNTITCDVYE